MCLHLTIAFFFSDINLFSLLISCTLQLSCLVRGSSLWIFLSFCAYLPACSSARLPACLPMHLPSSDSPSCLSVSLVSAKSLQYTSSFSRLLARKPANLPACLSQNLSSCPSLSLSDRVPRLRICWSSVDFGIVISSVSPIVR